MDCLLVIFFVLFLPAGDIAVADISFFTVTMDKYDRLNTFLLKKFGAFGTMVTENFFMPFDPEKGTLGFVSLFVRSCASALFFTFFPRLPIFSYAFIEYTTPESAAEAIRASNGVAFDKQHTTRVCSFREYERLMAYSTEFVAPQLEKSSAAENPKGWLLDEEGRDQFVVRHAGETEIYWHDALRGGRTLVYAGQREKVNGRAWTELYVQWSTKGTYLATFHGPGIMLWAGREFQCVGRFQHGSVKVVEFSPCEKFLITTNGVDPESTIIWDLASGRKVKSFPAAVGALQWSHDDAYFSHLTEEGVSVYSSSTMKMLDDKPIKAAGVKDVQWSPTANVLSYWVPDTGNTPARVSLLEIPSRTVVREKHLVCVTDARMHWHPLGTQLAVKVSRQNPAVKTPMSTLFEIFALDEKNVPVDSVEMKDQVLAFGWEPKGKRFALIHSNEQMKGKSAISFFSIKSKKYVVESSLEGRQANALFWSPAGNNIVLAQFKSNEEKTIEFYDANRKEVMAFVEHPLVTDVEWDPTGRYVLTQVNQPSLDSHQAKDQIDNGYKAWTCKGRLVHQEMINKCFQILWRPRPASMLATDHKDGEAVPCVSCVRKTFKDKYSKRFEAADEELLQANLTGAAKERKIKRDEWRSILEQHRQLYQEQQAARRALRDGAASDDDNDYVEVEVVEEVVLETKTETLRD
jgi:translation initiation factor 3 subunit B